MTIVGATLLLIAMAVPAAAHGKFGQVAPGDLLEVWQPDLEMTLALVAVALLYALGRARLNRHARRGVIPLPKATLTFVGLASLWIALASPLAALTGPLLTAHMAQHVILIGIAPPLLLGGRPAMAVMALVPARAGLVPMTRRIRSMASVARPVPAALIHGAAVWVWHAPPLFEAALASEALHQLEHACFFLTALFFWSTVFHAARAPSRRMEGAAALVVTLIHGGLLGALLTLAARPLYAGHGDGSPAWGLTPLADQQLAGLVMWVPAGAVYLAAGIIIATRLVGGLGDPTRQPATHRR